MAAPLKPWERAGVNSQNPGPAPVNSMSGSPPAPCCVQGTTSAPPPVPARPAQSTIGARPYAGGYGMGSSMGYSPYSSYGGGLYNSPYSSYGSYGYGGYGGGYNRFGGNQDSMSGFARHAEENSRPAFQAIESVVSAVSSVGMMMDSTFQAVYNSFRAVIGVADNMSRLKSQLVSVISALAFIRTLKYIYRRFLELLRLRPPGHAAQAWNDAVFQAAANMAPGEPSPKNSAWPIIMFFSIIMGGPWLIWKVIRSFSDGSVESNSWANGDEDHFVARAEHDFRASNNTEISFTAGQMINIAPKEMQPKVRGWLLGCADGSNTGLLPANYLKVLGKRRGKKYQTPTPQGVPAPPASITPSESAFSLTGPTPSSTTLNSVPESNLDTVFNEATSAELDASDILDKCGSEGNDCECPSVSQPVPTKDCCAGKST
ncbi:peroxisomal membrane protein PEX13-like [Haliotis rufescens]|uniref:peroxisomal membrane protein PEX13-like n=1 Tax=Haliotis rufescens TaxID=6454 RepID=UPI00201F9A54|nr:peroxisomal membrane protein PEX13-like [Haliotis rufescens]